MALHSTFWHNGFGERLSHGCVNMRPDDAKWVFRWCLPEVPFESGDITVSHAWRYCCRCSRNLAERYLCRKSPLDFHFSQGLLPFYLLVFYPLCRHMSVTLAGNPSGRENNTKTAHLPAWCNIFSWLQPGIYFIWDQFCCSWCCIAGPEGDPI